jgi:N-acetylmuramoyl-L-alanine amidase
MNQQTSALNRYIPLLPCMLWLFGILHLQVFASESVQIKYPIGPLPDTSVAVLQSGDILYIDLDGFAEALNIRTYRNDAKGKIQYSIGSLKAIYSTDNPFVIIGDRIHQLPSEVVFHSDRYWAPMDAFLEQFKLVYPADIFYERYLWIITIQPSEFDAYAIAYDQKENGTLVRLSCTRKFEISGTALRDKKLTISLFDVNFNRDAFEMTPKSGAVKELIIEELPESVQLTFKLSEKALEHSVWWEENPYQLNISLVTRFIESQADSSEVGRLQDEIANILENEQERWKIDCVVIDPGHGGRDPGALGPMGLKEKTVVLDVAKRVKTLLEKEKDFRVVLTREEDKFLALNERTKLANQAGGKLFISIHCNSSEYKSASGFETYFLKPARNERAMEVALKENSVIRYEESRNQYQDLTEENYILLAMAQAEFTKESEDLAAIFQRNMHMRTQLRDRGVDQAGFYVLVGASMPAILFESAFISNKREEKLLKQKKFRQKIAQAMYDSIMEFKELQESDQVGIR